MAFLGGLQATLFPTPVETIFKSVASLSATLSLASTLEHCSVVQVAAAAGRQVAEVAAVLLSSRRQVSEPGPGREQQQDRSVAAPQVSLTRAWPLLSGPALDPEQRGTLHVWTPR